MPTQHKNINFYKSCIPNLFTISAFIFGFNAINLAINGNIKGAIFSLIIASILDLFDGRLARILGVNSKFGAELDSLSDLVCFGIATAFIVLFYQDPVSKILFFAVCFFAICCMLRLARFNVAALEDESPSLAEEYKEDKNYFVGVPSPAGFLLAILPIALNFALESTQWVGFVERIDTNMYAVYVIIVGFLMVSGIPTPSTKQFNIAGKHILVVLGVAAFTIMCFINFTWATIAIFDIIYIVGIICFAFSKYYSDKGKKKI